MLEIVSKCESLTDADSGILCLTILPYALIVINPIKSDIAAYILDSWIDSVIFIGDNIPSLDCIRLYFLQGSVLQPGLSQVTGSWTCMPSQIEVWLTQRNARTRNSPEYWTRILKMSINLLRYVYHIWFQYDFNMISISICFEQSCQKKRECSDSPTLQIPP